MIYVTIAVLLIVGFVFSVFGMGVGIAGASSRDKESQMVAALSMLLMSGAVYILAGYMMGKP